MKHQKKFYYLFHLDQTEKNATLNLWETRSLSGFKSIVQKNNLYQLLLTTPESRLFDQVLEESVFRIFNKFRQDKASKVNRQNMCSKESRMSELKAILKRKFDIDLKEDDMKFLRHRRKLFGMTCTFPLRNVPEAYRKFIRLPSNYKELMFGLIDGQWGYDNLKMPTLQQDVWGLGENRVAFHQFMDVETLNDPINPDEKLDVYWQHRFNAFTYKLSKLLWA